MLKRITALAAIAGLLIMPSAYAEQPPKLTYDVAIEGYPAKGNADAKITLVELVDYQCPHCKNTVEFVDTLLKQYGDKLRVVYRDLDISKFGGSYKDAAKAKVTASLNEARELELFRHHPFPSIVGRWGTTTATCSKT